MCLGRNSLGKILTRRECEWQSGTSLALAVQFRCNTHTAPNFRVPPIPGTHSSLYCGSKNCTEEHGPNKPVDKERTSSIVVDGDRVPVVTVSVDPSSTGSTSKGRTPGRKPDFNRFMKVLTKLAQRAQREATGYYCGYTFKAQPVGAKYLRAAGESLNYMDVGLNDKTSGQKWHAATHRIYTEFQYRCTSRTAPEEVNLSSAWHEQDPLNAEFIRTYRACAFPGQSLVELLEREFKQALKPKDLRKVVPTRASYGSGPDVLLKHFADFYAYRGVDPQVKYLSPWEFLMLWEVLPLTAPESRKHDNDKLPPLSMHVPETDGYTVNDDPGATFAICVMLQN